MRPRRSPKRDCYRGRVLIATAVALDAAFFSGWAAAECRVDDPRARLPDVRVTVGAASFSLGLDGVPVQIRPDTGTERARVDVLAPLRFEASYPAAELRYRVARAVELYGGRIRLGPGAMPEWLGVRGNALEVSLVEMLQVNVKEPLRVPCSHVALSDGKEPYATPEPVPPAPERGAGTGDAQVPLHLFPVAADPITVQFRGAYEIESRRPGWVLLSAAWADGSRVRGWTQEQWALAPPMPLEGHVQGMSSGVGCGRADGPTLTTFRVRRGAPFAAAPGGAPWAWATRKLEVRAFPLDREDGWVQVGALEGLTSKPCSEHEHVWVHVSDLVWPNR